MFEHIEKIKQHTLFESAFAYVIKNNHSANLPYHNNKHLLGVFNVAMDIADIEKINEKEKLELGIACLFHDIKHSGGVLKDNQNIAIAVDELYKFFKTIDVWEVNINNIVDIIWCTEFPSNKKPISMVEKIITDADLLQAFDKEWFLFAVNGLAKERGVSVSQSIKDQINFISNISLHTPYGQDKLNDIKDDYLNQLNYLSVVFE